MDRWPLRRRPLIDLRGPSRVGPLVVSKIPLWLSEHGSSSDLRRPEERHWAPRVHKLGVATEFDTKQSCPYLRDDAGDPERPMVPATPHTRVVLAPGTAFGPGKQRQTIEESDVGGSLAGRLWEICDSFEEAKT